MLCCAVLCCAVLCCAVLCCAVPDHRVVLSLAIQLHMCNVLRVCEVKAQAKNGNNLQERLKHVHVTQTHMFTCNRHINKGTKLCAVTQAVTIPGGFDALATVANQMIVQSSCNTLAPIIQALFQIYPTIQDLDLNSAQLAEVQQMNPQLVSCIVSSIARS